MDKFETWWQQEGQEFLYALNTTTDDDIKLVAEIAWKNGAYCAEQEKQEPVVFYRCNGCGHAYESFAPSSCDCMGGQDFSRIEYYAAPVRTKDLTDDEIEDLYFERFSMCTLREFARAVIAKDREKNK